MSGDSFNKDGLPFLFAPAEQDLLLSVPDQLMLGGVKQENEKLINNRKKPLFLSYERLNEFFLTQLFFGLESYYDISKVPENYTSLIGITRDNAPILDLTPETAQVFNSLGDVLEISVGSGIVRFSMAVVEQIVRSEPVKNIVKNAMAHEGLKKMMVKTIGSEKSEELSKSGELIMSDDAQFWTALVPWTIVKAAHSLGLISLGANDHMGAPVPHMLIGQAFAVASLVAVHYGTKNANEIARITTNIFNKTSELASTSQRKFESRMSQYEAKSKDSAFKVSVSIDNHLIALSQKMEEWIKKIDEFDPNKVIPSPEKVGEKILGERIWSALASIGIENDKDTQE